jgi:hypothetical protein
VEKDCCWNKEVARIQDISPPLNHSSYQEYRVQFPGPYVRCSQSGYFQGNATEQIIEKIMQIHEGTYFQWINTFTGFIPIYGGVPADVMNETTSVVVNGTQIAALWDANAQRPLNSSRNEIWMRFWRYPKNSSSEYIRGPDGQRPQPDKYYLTCQLYRATYDVTFSWSNGVQTVINNTVNVGDLVPYPRDIVNHPSDVVAHAYSAIFLVLANEIVGTTAFYNDTATNSPADYVDEPPNFSSSQTRILENSLTGSDDLDYYFAINKLLFSKNPPEPFSDQRLQDKAVAKNKTLDLLIEELCYNITISLLHDPLLADIVNATMFKHANDGNQYEFAWHNLVIAYSLAITATVTAVLLGFWAYRRNGAAFDRSPSTLISVSRSGKLDPIFPNCCHGVQPLPLKALETKLYVNVTPQGQRPGRNIVPAERVEVICPVCDQTQSRRPSWWQRRSVVAVENEER